MIKFLRTTVKWWRIWGTLPVRTWVRAAELYREGKYEDAVRAYEYGLVTKSSHPGRHCARMDQAFCQFRLGQIREAEKNLRRVQSEVPASIEASARLAQLYAWSGDFVRACEELSRLVERKKTCPKYVAQFVLYALHPQVPQETLRTAISALLGLERSDLALPELEVARACLAVKRGDIEKGRAVLALLVGKANAPIEAHIQFAEILFSEGKLAHMRRQLRRALSLSPDHPGVLSLFAQSYLEAGPFYNPEFAMQLATKACQAAGWLSPAEMHVLAKAHFHIGDRVSALLIASKAQDVALERFGQYSVFPDLSEFIETLSSGTLG